MSARPSLRPRPAAHRSHRSSRPVLSRPGALVGAVAAALAVAGCGSPVQSETPPTESPAGQASEFPVTIEHALGTTVVEEAPERVVTIGWASQDTVLALGITPVGVPFDQFAGDPETGLLPWTAEAVERLGGEQPTTFVDLPEVDVEEVAALDPDLILATYSGISQDVYDQLSALAPTVAYPEQPWLVSWQDQTLINGRALGLEAEARELVESTEARIAQAAADNPSLDGVTFAYVYANPDGTLGAYVEGDPRVDLLTGLGMELAPGIADLDVAEGTFYADLGTENADLLDDADVLITWFNDEAQQEEVESSATFSSIPAVQRGSYVPLLDRSLSMATSTSTALSVPWGLDEFVPRLVEAAEAV